MNPLTNYGIALDLANTIKVLIQITRKASRKSDFFFSQGYYQKVVNPFLRVSVDTRVEKKILKEKIPK